MKGRILLKALELLKDCALSQADFFEAVLASGYGASMGRVDYNYSKIRQRRENQMWRNQERDARRKRLQNFLYQMKHDGLIGLVKKDKEISISVSKKGRQKIKELQNKLPDRHYPKTMTDRTIIISFDIPEKSRGKRDWFREVVKNLGSKMIHQSVWIGQRKIPKGLIDDLEDLKIIEYIEIFEVTKSGTLRKL